MPDDRDDDRHLDEDDERRRRLRRRDPDDENDRPRRRGPDEEHDRARRPRRREAEFEATDILIPTGVSAYSMAACYFGLFSCFIPVLGLLMALIALPCGIVALKRRKKKATYGAVTGDIRAILGIVCSSLTLLGYLFFLVLAVTGSLK